MFVILVNSIIIIIIIIIISIIICPLVYWILSIIQLGLNLSFFKFADVNFVVFLSNRKGDVEVKSSYRGLLVGLTLLLKTPNKHLRQFKCHPPIVL